MLLNVHMHGPTLMCRKCYWLCDSAQSIHRPYRSCS